jgi:hypothetical protein
LTGLRPRGAAVLPAMMRTTRTACDNRWENTSEPVDIRRLLPELPEPLTRVTMRLIERDPDRRPRSAAEVMQVLKAAADS